MVTRLNGKLIESNPVIFAVFLAYSLIQMLN